MATEGGIGINSTKIRINKNDTQEEGKLNKIPYRRS